MFKSNAFYENERFLSLSEKNKIFEDIVFENCDFSGCDFCETKFVNCKFTDCLFKESNLSLCSFTGSRFVGENSFYNSKLLGVLWIEAHWSDFISKSPLQFYDGCKLDNSSFFGLTLVELVLEDCSAIYVDFRESHLESAVFKNTNFSGSLFQKTNLASAHFEGAKGYSIDITDNNIDGATFSRFDALGLLEPLNINLVD